ncbi:MAG: hypothetical protein ACO1O1_03780 [Adhaeribacter sp.]
MKSKNENPNQKNDDFGQKGGVSGQPPASHQGQVSGDARNTRGMNVPSHQGQSGGAKKGKFDPEPKSPQGSNAKPSDSRGADSSDKEFRNNQPNASTLQGHKNKPGAGKDKK